MTSLNCLTTLISRPALILFFLCLAGSPLWSAAGREGASFLDIPVGAEPAALGSAYTALAENGYAPVWNPAGLASLDVPEISGMHLSYLESIHYEHLSAAIPWHTGEHGRGFGISLQSLGSGDIEQRDDAGNLTGNFSTSFGAYSLGYGQDLGERSALGAMVKIVREKIADASVNAYAIDLGWLFHVEPDLTLGAAISNLGTSLKLVNQSDPLPAQARVGTAWHFHPDFMLSDDIIYRRNGPIANALGLEWSNSTYYAIRGGYNTSHTKELGAVSGLSAGAALRFLGQEFAYAWVPFGDLGNTHYFSLLLRFSTDPRPDHAYPDMPKARLRQAKRSDDDFDRTETPAAGYHDYGNIYDVLSDEERRSLKKYQKDRKDDDE